MAHNIIHQHHKRASLQNAAGFVVDSDEEEEEALVARQQSQVKKNLLATNFDLGLNKCESFARNEGDVSWLMQQSFQGRKSMSSGRRACPSSALIDIVPCLSHAVQGAQVHC